MSMFSSGLSLPRARWKAHAGSARFFLHALLLGILALSLCSCRETASISQTTPSFTLHAKRWPEAEMLFKKDRYWLGGDGAYSIDLDAGRVVWLFGDSFIGNGVSRDRQDAVVVRNTVALQKGYNPASSSAAFYWKTAEGKPEAFFQAHKPFWYWPGSGIRIRDRLLVFLMKIEPSHGGFGFAVKGWEAMLVGNPGEEPDQWKMTRLKVPGNSFNVIVGSACCISDDSYLYAFGAHAVDHGAFLVRWKLSDVTQGNLMNLEWWTGSGGWVGQGNLARAPEPLFPEAQMEFTVHYERAIGRFLEVQTDSFTSHCLASRWSKSLTGPWSEKSRFYCPQGTWTKDLLVYAGKAHPGLSGADLVCTYALNSLDLKRLLEDDSLYYPVFLKATFQMHEQ